MRRALACTTTILTLACAAPAAAATGYHVRWGDTLTAIAARYHTSVVRLERMNRLFPPRLLLAGTTIRVPGGAAPGAGQLRYTVRWGDTLTGIASAHGTTVARLARLNGLDPGGVLLAGAILRLPTRGAHTGRGHSVLSGRGRLEARRRMVRGWIDHWAAHYGVDRHLVRAVAWMESGYRIRARSPAGARGVMQITPPTWRYGEDVLIGTPVPHTPFGNIRIGVAYLHQLLREFGGRERLAVAAYYQGPRAVRLFGVLPPSRVYVRDVLALRRRI